MLIMRPPLAYQTLLGILISCFACGGDIVERPGNGYEVVREQVGDTLVVRTVSGSVWGTNAELVPEVEVGLLEGPAEYLLGDIVALAVDDRERVFALDGQASVTRGYDAAGRHVGDWGRRGNGPGELAGPDAGLVMLSDGRLVVRDPGNARLQLFDPESGDLEQWPVISGGFRTLDPMRVNAGDTIYTFAVMNMDDASPDQWQRGLLGIYEGGVVDSVVRPDIGFQAAEVMVRGERGVNFSVVPFSPREHAEWHRDGFWIHGIADRYALTLLDPTGPIRIERDVPPVQVKAAERTWHRGDLTRRMRQFDPAWTWNAPDISEEKPAYGGIWAAEDGRIWVQRPGEGVRTENPNYDPEDPENTAPEFTWSDSHLFDVFERDGTFLGTVRAPDNLQQNPRPVLRGDHVWGIAADEFGTQRIVRYRIEVGEG